MKINIRLQLLALLFFIIFWGCNSTNYDIVEVEEKVDIPVTNTQDTGFGSQTNNEIKEDLTNKIPENKFTDKQVVAHMYSVQIGAFLIEDNATSFTDKAKKQIDPSVYYKQYGGLFKVRIGSFNSISEAVNLMNKLINLGYYDSFVVELTYVQNQ